MMRHLYCVFLLLAITMSAHADANGEGDECYVYLADMDNVELRYEPKQHLRYTLSNTHLLVGDVALPSDTHINIYEIVTNEIAHKNIRLLIKQCTNSVLIMGAFSQRDTHLFSHDLIQAQFFAHINELIVRHAQLPNQKIGITWNIRAEFDKPILAFGTRTTSTKMLYLMDYYGGLAARRFLSFMLPNHTYSFATQNISTTQLLTRNQRAFWGTQPIFDFTSFHADELRK